MGTRGIYGVVIDQQLKATYNHWDSYPEGLGANLIEVIKKYDINVLRSLAADIELIDENVTPTKEQQEKFKHLANLSVEDQSLDSWYCLLRQLQGDLEGHLANKVMSDGHLFAADSLFCEYGYILDLDREVLEFYRGFRTRPHSKGRFCKLPNLPLLFRKEKKRTTYYQIELVAEIPFQTIRNHPTTKTVTVMEYAAKDEVTASDSE